MRTNPDLFVAVNATGEVTLFTPSFWDMCVSFLQLTVIIWMSLLVLYGGSHIVAFWHRCQRRMAMRSIKTTSYHQQYACVFHLRRRGQSEECSICLESFKEGDAVKTLPCHHVFHANCVKEWIVDIRGVCPLCRQGIYPVDSKVFVATHS